MFPIRVFREHSYHVSDHPLARKVRCGICGYALTRSGSRNKSYSCQTHKFVENMECMDVHVSEDGLWAAILESLRAQAVIALDRERFVLEQRKTMQQQLDSVRKRLLALHEKQERCSRESRELYETFAMGSLNRVDYLVQKSALTEKKTEIAQQISELQAVFVFSLDPRPITHSTTSGSLFLYRVAAALGRALSRLHRAHDPGAPECTHAIRSIRAGVSGRYPFISPVGRSVL